jgi:hypothetical protein
VKLSEKSARILGLIAAGHSYDQIVSGENVTYADIFLAAEEALRLTGAPDGRDRLAAIKAKFPNAYERWTEAEDAALTDMHRSGASTEAMAKRFSRQPSAITSRLSKLGLGHEV